jgi:formate hydrogenlyase transcriptional activator
MGTFERAGPSDRDRTQRRFEQIIGNSSALESVFGEVERVAPTDSTVLIRGETGTGKELIARAIHNISSRCGRPFIKLNCAAIPFDLLESELFGHEKGAFTGAIAQKIGRFEAADKGTLFLDEVGDIPLALQPKLLRVLQEQEFERLGSARTHQVDVRLLAATHRDLADMVKRGEFRSDLYYRMNVFPIQLPPLRARSEDIPALVAHFVEIYGRRMGKQIDHIPPAAISALSSYPWPGNVRELQNFIERSVILSDGTVLRSPLAELKHSPGAESLGAVTLKDAERDHILKTLKQTRWVVAGPNGAAARLGMKRSTLYFRMQKLGISRFSDDLVSA